MSLTNGQKQYIHKRTVENQFKPRQLPAGRVAFNGAKLNDTSARLLHRSTVPHKDPRPAGQPNKIAVRSEGSRSWGSGIGNNVNSVGNGVNATEKTMERRIDRFYSQRRKKKTPKVVMMGSGREQPPVSLPGHKIERPAIYRPVVSPEDRAAEAKVMPTWGDLGQKTVADFRKRWR